MTDQEFSDLLEEVKAQAQKFAGPLGQGSILDRALLIAILKELRNLNARPTG